MKRLFPIKMSLAFTKHLNQSPLDIWEREYLRPIKFGSFIQVLPLNWEKSKGVYQCSLVKNLTWHLLVILYCIDLSYLLWMSGDVTLEKYSDTQFVNFFQHLVSRLTAGSLIISIALGQKPLLQFCNALVRMRKNFEAHWRLNLARPSTNEAKSSEESLAKLFVVVSFIVHLQPIGPLLLHWHNRMSPQYWPAVLLDRSVYNFFIFKIAYALTDLLFSFLAMLATTYVALTALSYLGLAKIWLEKISEQAKYGLSFDKTMRLFGEQLVFNKFANSVLSGQIMPTFVTGGGFVIGGAIVALLRGDRNQPFSASANFASAVFAMLWGLRYVLHLGALLFKISEIIKRHLIVRNGVTISRYQLRELRSCSQVRVYMRNDFYFQGTTYASFLSTLSDNTISYLLATES